MNLRIRRSTTWLLLGVSLTALPGLCLARGGHGGGGRHIGGGARMGGAQHFGGGNLGGGRSSGFAPSQSFRQHSFGGSQGMHVPQIRSNFNAPSLPRGGQGLGGATIRNTPLGGQGVIHHGVTIQPAHRFPSGTGLNFGQGAGQRISIQPNHGLYGQGIRLNQGSGGIGSHQGIGARMQNGLTTHPGVGNLTHSAGRPVLYGTGVSNLGGLQHRVIGTGINGSRQIGAGNSFAGHPTGGAQLAGTTGHHHGGLNTAQFHGRNNYNNWNSNNAWGINHHHGNVNSGNWNTNYRYSVVNNNYYGWYNNPWNGLWGFGWGYPYYSSAFSWGLGPYYSPTWGYGGYGGYGGCGGFGGYLGYGGGYTGAFGYGAYYNPYCVSAPQTVYVNPLGANYYTQPISLPLAVADATVTVSAEDVKRDAAFKMVEQGRKLFISGDYRGALDKYDSAIPSLKNDPVVHELRALALFALGDYHESAATLNALLAVAPGMDWHSMRNQYPTAAAYTAHLRALEAFLRESPNDAAARFVLGYHYLVTNFPDAAAKQFEKVVQLESRDAVAKKLLETLTKGQTPAKPDPLLPGVDAGAPLQTDLVGKWFSQGEDGSQFALTLDEGGEFTWLVTPPKGNPVKQTGKYTAAPDRLILDSSGPQETLVARVESRGPNHFRFWITDDASLAFRREGVTDQEPIAAGKHDAGVLLPAPIPARSAPSAVSPENVPQGHSIELPETESEAPVSAADPSNSSP